MKDSRFDHGSAKKHSSSGVLLDRSATASASTSTTFKASPKGGTNSDGKGSPDSSSGTIRTSR